MFFGKRLQVNYPEPMPNMAGQEGVQNLLAKHKGKIVNDLDVTSILPDLVSKRVITYSEEKHLLSLSNSVRRSEEFITILYGKGADAFQEFCTALEHTNPRLLTYFLLESFGKLSLLPSDFCGNKSVLCVGDSRLSRVSGLCATQNKSIYIVINRGYTRLDLQSYQVM